MPSQTLTTDATNGIRLQIEFLRLRDRYAHIISASVDGTNIPLLESIEGAPTDSSPPSPPFQNLSIEPIAADRRAALLVGMAGKGHWSASIEASQDASAFIFDIACRENSTSQSFSSTYRILGGAEHSILDRACILKWPQLALTLTTEHNSLIRATGAEPLILPVASSRDQKTRRWKYEFRLVPRATAAEP